MSSIHLTTNSASNEVKDVIKPQQANTSKLHQVLLDHMIKNSKRVEIISEPQST